VVNEEGAWRESLKKMNDTPEPEPKDMEWAVRYIILVSTPFVDPSI
jgi:hypothetical protein|tara:strand:+ start:8004 stop:8141 length:138 start_codon:yes stop_codon:yes gene_type:complete